MMKYMIVHRGDTIYRICFVRETDDLYYLETGIGVFACIYGWESERVMKWLDKRDFEYYWERNGHD